MISRPLNQLRDSVANTARVARFVRGLAEFQVRPDDVFISSYPRSGTTWMQHIMHVLRSNGDTSFGHINEVAPWFERSLSLGRMRARDFDAMPSPRIFKSHLPRRWLPRGARYVYVQRDGRDVAVSYFHFYRSHLGFTGDFDEFFSRFLTGSLQYGSWFKHVAGWHAYTHDRTQLIVDYERLRHDLPSEMARIGSFCGTPLDAESLTRLASLCDFNFMREHEQKFDHAAGEPGAQARQHGAFIRRGRSGDHQSELTAEHRRRFSEQQRRAVRAPTLELQLAEFLR